MPSEQDAEIALLPTINKHSLKILYEHLENETVDTRKIDDIVNKNPGILTAKFKQYRNMNILQVACSILAKNICKEENIEVLSMLATEEALFYANAKENGKEAIHYACSSRKPEILTEIIQKILIFQPERINSRTNKGETALHFLTKKNPIDSFECIKVLITNHVDVNISDNDNVTPLLYALKKLENYTNGTENKNDEIEIMKEVISILVNEGSRLTSHRLNKKTARDYILELGLDVPLNSVDEQQDEKSQIFGFLKEGDTQKFLEYENIQKHTRCDDGIVTLLQLACIKGCVESVKFLLRNKANIAQRTQKNDYPIIIAARTGHFEIFETLLKRHKKHDFFGKAALELTKNLYKKNSETINHEKCLNVLLQRRFVDVNYKDDEGTPLHCASKLRKTAVCLKLLKMGALLSTKDDEGNTPIKYLDRNTLKKHFNFCIYYSTLDHFNNPWILEEDRKVGKSIKLEYKSILPENGECHMDVLYDMSKKYELKDVFDHPLISSFLDLKFVNIIKLYRLNALIYILFCALLYLHIFLVYMKNTNLAVRIVSSFSLSLLVTIFTLKIFFQARWKFRQYFKNVDHVIEFILLLVTMMIILDFLSMAEYKKQFAATAIVLSAYELLIYFGQLPYFSTNVKMLKKVTSNFLKFMLWYCCLIFGFALSFYVLFRNENLPNENKSENSKFFGNYWFSIVKSVVMLTGEFDANSIPLELYPITGVVIFITFILMISVVVFNLLNGLAVDDIQEIRRKAIIIHNISRVRQMSNLEFFFEKLCKYFTNPVKRTLSNWLYSDLINNGEVEITVDGKLHKHVKDVYLNEATLEKIRQLIDMEKIEERYVWHMKNVRQELILERYKQTLQTMLDAKCKQMYGKFDEILEEMKKINTAKEND